MQLLNLVFGIFLARLLSTTDYGMVAVLTIFSATAGIFSESGFILALVNKKEVNPQDYNSVFWFNISIGITPVSYTHLLSACGGKKSETVSLNGEIKGLGNDTLYIYGADRLYDRMDTLLVKDDKFSATLTPDTLVETYLLFSNGSQYPLFMDKGDKIRIKGCLLYTSKRQREKK